MKFSEIYSVEQKTLNSIYSWDRVPFSVEIFPPKEPNYDIKCENLYTELAVLQKYKPSLISVTYGAGGSNQQKSIDIVRTLLKKFETPVMPHFTCVGSTEEFIENYLEEIRQLGIHNILALRGDLPSQSELTHMSFPYADGLVKFISEKTDFSIAVAGYPEGHNKNELLKDNIINLKRKIDNGGEIIYTQLFFDNTYFFDYLETLDSVGINVPVIPGILPISSFTQLDRMVSMCNVSIPKQLAEKVEKYKDSPEDIKNIGIDFATFQVQQLIDYGVKGIHFYCLNKSQPLVSVLENLGY